MLDALKKAPYYDDYFVPDQNGLTHKDKSYTQLLAIPGRVAQAREITQIQSVMKDIVKSLGDSILKDGNIIEGCQVMTFTDTDGKRKARVTAGKVYLSGMVLPVAETVVLIRGTGNETVGVKLVEEIVTYDGVNGDNTLRDPAQGYANFNQPGCDRLKSYVVVVANEPESAIIASLIDGSLAVEKYAPEYDTLTQTLARRTYDESGSYIVEGLTVRTENTKSDFTRTEETEHLTPDQTYTVVVESGKAYVLGYELKIPSARRLVLPRSLEIVQRTQEHYIYEDAPIRIADNPYIQDLLSVVGRRNNISHSLTVDSNTGRSLLGDTGVLRLISVSDESRSYNIDPQQGTLDCRLEISEDSRCWVRWLGNNTPAGSYSVEYEYNHVFLKDTDYYLYRDPSDDSHNVAWLPGGNTPIYGSPMRITYNLYLARKDLIYIDQYGNIGAELGIPATYGFETQPEAPVNTLPLAYIYSPPSGDVSSNSNLRISTTNIGLTRFTMNDIQNILNRIRTIEYDQTILSLNDQAKQYDTGSLEKKGILTDPLIDLSKIDLSYNKYQGEPVNLSLPYFDAAIDLVSNLCYLPVKTKTYDAVYNEDDSTVMSLGRTATLNSSVEPAVALSQMNATKSFLINPYSMFPQMPEISLSPAVDVWIEDSIIEVPVSQSTSAVVSQSTRNIERYNTSGARRADTITSTSQDTAIGTKVETFTNESVISESSITHIRVRDIEVEGIHYPAGLDNIRCYFDGVEAVLTPLEEGYAGTAHNTVKADSSGKFRAKFRIPENVLTGIREVRLASDTIVDGYMNSAFALYQASGTSRTIQRTVTTLTTVLLNRVTTVTTTHNIDPVGQTFVLDRMTIVSGIDLYFEAKPSGETPVTCDIREVVNGTITSTVYAHKTLSASEVRVSSDSSVATRFIFDDPAVLEENKEYAFVVRSTSPSYRIWIAELGEKDIQTTDPVLSNPYMIGVMMSSSNNSSWTNHQTSDIKFRLLSNIYDTSSEVLFRNIYSDEGFSRIYLLAETLVPNGTSISWEYSLDSGATYSPITPYSIISKIDGLANSILLKAKMNRGANNNLSPILALDSVGVVLSSYDTSKGGWYVTHEVDNIGFTDEVSQSGYTNVDIILDTYTYESGTSINVFIQSDVAGLVEATYLPNASTNNKLSYNWETRTYRATVPKSSKCRISVKLSSAHSYTTPAFRRLRAIFS